jgi:2-methylisocitrate lyase-like PEP mutase family enzyme
MEINLGHIPPLFAHDVAMSTVTKAKKTKRGKVKKESFTELVFIDALRKMAIARIILPQDTLEALPKMIEENLKKIKKEQKSKEMPKDSKTETSKTASSYLG